jgi:hypothetical protein
MRVLATIQVATWTRFRKRTTSRLSGARRIAMNTVALALVALAFGGLAWGMLVVSDWLLRDKTERLPPWHASHAKLHQITRIDARWPPILQEPSSDGRIP